MSRVVEDIYCKKCDEDTKHMFLGKSIPKQLRWKCSECGEYNFKTEPPKQRRSVMRLRSIGPNKEEEMVVVFWDELPAWTEQDYEEWEKLRRRACPWLCEEECDD